jgi:hypothetical protein
MIGSKSLKTTQAEVHIAARPNHVPPPIYKSISKRGSKHGPILNIGLKTIKHPSNSGPIL